MIKSIDLFSGAGGLAEGFLQAGIQSIVASDWDLMAAKTFTHNHSDIPFIQKNISDLSAIELIDASGYSLGNVDIVAGGPPCQGFSIAGQRITDDPRNKMFVEFGRIVRDLEPKIFLFENVSGLTSMKGGKVLKAIIQHFEDLGYICQWKILNASDYGVPQSRPRFILIGTQPSVNFTFPSRTHASVLEQTSLFDSELLPKLTVWDAIADLPEIGQGQGEEEMYHEGNYENEYQMARRGRRTPGLIYNHRATRHSDKIQNRYSLIPEGKNNSSLPPEIRTRKTNVFKLDRNKPSRTVTCNHRTDLLHPTIPRGTTVREVARLQSFDDDYQFFGNLTRKAAWVTQDDQVGNAVPPLLSKVLGESILSALKKIKMSNTYAA